MTKKSLVRELSGRTGLTQRQISMVLSELATMEKKRIQPAKKSPQGRNGEDKVNVVELSDGEKIRFTKRDILALVGQEPTLDQIMAKLEREE
jgi:hypothetical protein